MPLAIDLMWVEDLSLRLSFRTDASSRPRWASGGFIRLGLDLAQLEDLALVLPGERQAAAEAGSQGREGKMSWRQRQAPPPHGLV